MKLFYLGIDGSFLCDATNFNDNEIMCMYVYVHNICLDDRNFCLRIEVLQRFNT